jgi:hypothetical protein
MCGDTQCPSCGPAQGNYRCPICRAWADDCCEHFEEETGELKPEFQAQAEEHERQEREADEKMAIEIAESERLAEAYWNSYVE